LDLKTQLSLKNKKINEYFKKMEENGINPLTFEKIDVKVEEKENIKKIDIKFEEFNNFLEKNENYFAIIDGLTKELVNINKNE
jgi:hypothetical protein